MKENSYTELMKSNAMKKKLREDFIKDLYMEMFLNEILLKSEKAKLFEQIDHSIDQKDYELFIELSSQYKELSKRFGL